MAWIKTDNDHLERIRIEGMDDYAEFSDNNLAQVNQNDMDVLLDEYPEAFSEHTKNGD